MIIALQNRGFLYAFGFGWTMWIAKPAAVANEEIEQARSISRFVFSRVFGRVN